MTSSELKTADLTGGLFEASPLPTLVIDRDTLRVVAANPAAEERYGYSADLLLTLRFPDLTAPDDKPRQVAQREMPDGETTTIDLQRHRRKDGTVFPVHSASRGFRVGDQRLSMIVITELSELRPQQDEERFIEKMESLSRLGGGIALEFNNLLTAILATTDLALADANVAASVRADLQSIREAGQRATAITRQLMAFSGSQAISLRETDVNQLLGQLGPLLEHVLPANVLLRIEPQATGAILVDPARLEQVVLNLVMNAVEAMPNGGMLTVSTEDVNAFVSIVIADTGPGMDEITLARLFEPFYSTKGATGGRGLGLASVYGTVRQMNGSTDVESRSGAGTRVRMFFGKVEAPSESAPVFAPAPAPQKSELAGGEVVLVVEDEPSVRSPVCRMLRNLGYYVLEATNGKQALEVMEQHHAPVHLVISDVMMPEMDGAELVDLLRGWYPRMGVLFISGVSPDVLDAQRATTVRNSAFLPKPFSMQVLAKMVRGILDSEWGDRPA
jgi:two-component system cell cycle sensor histidine kinase/response regulator CckA